MKPLGFLVAPLIAAAAWGAVDFAELEVGDVTPRGTIIYKGNVATRDIPDDWETVWDQWYPDGAYAVNALGSVWVFSSDNDWHDIKAADNFKTDPAYDDYVLAGFDAGFAYYYCSPDDDKGLWALVWSDGGGVPASTEPYEFGLHPGWHEDLEAGNGGLRYAGILGLEWADYWRWGNFEEEYIGPLGEHDIHAHMEDAEGFQKREYYWRFDSTRDYWFCVQRYAGNG